MPPNIFSNSYYIIEEFSILLYSVGCILMFPIYVTCIKTSLFRDNVNLWYQSCNIAMLEHAGLQNNRNEEYLLSTYLHRRKQSASNDVCCQYAAKVQKKWSGGSLYKPPRPTQTIKQIVKKKSFWNNLLIKMWFP